MSSFSSAHSPQLLNAASVTTPISSESLSAMVSARLSHLLAESRNIEAMGSEIAALLCEAFSAEAALVETIDDRDPADKPTTYWYCNRDRDGISAVAPAAWEAIERQAEDFTPFAIIPLDSGSLLGVRTCCYGRTNGIVALVRSTSDWTEAEIEQLATVALQVGSLLDRVLQHRATATLEQQHRTLARLTRTIHASNDLDRILQVAIDGVGRALQVDRAAIILLKYNEVQLNKPEGDTTIPKAKATVVSQWLGDRSDAASRDRHFEQSFWLGECGWCARAFLAAPHPLVAVDREAVTDISPLPVLFRAAWLSAFSIFPLMSPNDDVQRTVLGFLIVQDSRPRRWKAEELELAELAGLQVSNAILQTKTLQRARSTIVDRDTQLHRSLEVQGKLYEQSRRQVEQLQRLNRQKDEFLSTISHELKTPLTSMRMAMKMLRQPTISGDRRTRYLDILEQQCQQEINLIDDLLTLQQIESKQTRVSVQTIDLKGAIAPLVEQFDRAWSHKGLCLEVRSPQRSLKIKSDAQSLNRILEELLTNAGKHSDPQTPVVLQLQHHQTDGKERVVVTLTNTAPAIPPEDLPHLFDKFTRGAGVTQKAIAGTGLGLALVKGLVQLLGGTIAVSCRSIPGTNSEKVCFSLVLPQTMEEE